MGRQAGHDDHLRADDQRKPHGGREEEMNEKLRIIAQISGYKNLKIEGGFRITLDIFESREQDVAALAILANRRKVVKITIEDHKEKP
jgi:hypothetical protein